MSDHFSDPDIDRFLEHFPQEADLVLQVLKGHLLVEENVREAIDIALANPDALKGSSGASFNCHQAICLLEALVPSGEDTAWIWKAAKKLNRVRNKLAHNLSHESLSSDVSVFVQFCLDNEPEIITKANAQDIPKEAYFMLSTITICAALSSLKEVLSKCVTYVA